MIEIVIEAFLTDQPRAGNRTRTVCIQVYHAYHYTTDGDDSDIEFIKDFKCESCLKGRRLSLSSLPVLSISNAQSVVAAVPVIAEPNAVAVDCVVAAEAQSSFGKSSNGVSVADELSFSLGKSNAKASAELNEVSLDLLLREVRLLKISQFELISLVTSLSNDNVKLISKVAELENTISKFWAQTSQIMESSPKRKKNSSTPVIVTPAADDTGANNAAFSFAHIARSSKDFPALRATTATSQWNEVRSKKKKKTPLVVGANNSSDLGVLVKKKWFHLSSFKSSVKADDIVAFVAKNTNIDEKELSCFALNKKDAVVTELKFINFKLGVPEVLLDKVFNSMFWPSNIKVRHFLFVPKEAGVLKEPIQSEPAQIPI